MKISSYFKKTKLSQPLSNKPNLWDLLVKRSLEDTANFVEKNLESAIYRPSRELFYSSVVNSIQKNNGLVCEFGVYNGRSINLLSRMLPNSIFFGFDSFTGLPEKWSGNDLDKGYFNRWGIPPVTNENVELRIGSFADTIPNFINDISKETQIDLLHIDCDIYSSTKTVLDLCHSNIQSGTLIVFDEYFGYPNWRNHEHKAFTEFLSQFGYKHEYLFYRTRQLCVQIK